MASSPMEELQQELNKLPQETRDRLHTLLKDMSLEETNDGLMVLEKMEAIQQEKNVLSLLTQNQELVDLKNDPYLPNDHYLYLNGEKTLLESFKSFRNRGNGNKKSYLKSIFRMENMGFSFFATFMQTTASYFILNYFKILSSDLNWFWVGLLTYFINLILIHNFFETINLNETYLNGHKDKNSISEFIPTNTDMEEYPWTKGKTLLSENPIYLPHMPILNNKQNIEHLKKIWNDGDTKARDLLIKKLENNEYLTMDEVLFMNLYLEKK